jgi:CRP-like cAMP-binding protein
MAEPAPLQDCDFFVILEGKVAVVEGYGSDERVLRIHGPGRFLGELGLLTGQAALVTSVVRERGEVLAVPVEHLRSQSWQPQAAENRPGTPPRGMGVDDRWH